VLVSARRFADLDVVSEELKTPDQVEKAPRTVQAVELVASADDALVALEHRPEPDRYGLSGLPSRRQDGDPGRSTVSG